jgi:hypothetical protein
VVVAPALRTVRDRDLSPSIVRTPDDGSFDDGLVLVEHALDLGAGDVLTAGHDHVLESIDDVEVPVVVLHADVSSVEPAAGERDTRCVRIPPVALEHLRAPKDDFPTFTCGHRSTVLVPDVEL